MPSEAKAVLYSVHYYLIIVTDKFVYYSKEKWLGFILLPGADAQRTQPDDR